ncbi:hypothetical protein WJX73_003973 [Symbiochloris irregularis]|uniref:Signal recognition particle subunit SRP72 n=1 Tax=Symbiochloris irregularis TaxID=706552 RepID=A0AAW1NSP8_9CHLO
MNKGGGTGAAEAAFSRLSDQLKNRQYKKALKTADEILKLDPDDQDALKCKAYVLLETGKFSEASDLLQGSKLQTKSPYEEAYCLYRSGEFRKALSACEATGEDKAVAKLHLQAQLHYRLGQYSEAIQMYKQLSQRHKVHSLELGTNVVAAHVAAGRSRDVLEVMAAMRMGPHEGFEAAFNLGCAQLATGQLDAAHDQLLHAQRLGQEAMLDEELEGEELEIELAPVTLQLALVAARLGRHSEAASAHQAISRLKLDPESSTVLQNNQITDSMLTNSDSVTKKSFTDALRKLEPLVKDAPRLQLVSALQSRLAEGQQRALLVNYALLTLLAGRAETCHKMVSAMADRWPRAQSVALLQAAWAAHAEDSAAADAALDRAASSDVAGEEVDTTWPLLMRAQLASARGDSGRAAASFEQAAQELQRHPAVIATRAALAEATGNVQTALGVVTAALQQQGVEPGAKKVPRGVDQAAVHWLLQRLAGLQLQAGQVSAALATFAQLKTAGGGVGAGGLRVLGQLAKANLSETSPNLRAVADLEAQLPSVASLPDEEVDRLETSVPGAAAMKRRKAAGQRPQDDQDAPKKKRKRKQRLPKDFDPENPRPLPDPERWLPKWQRSDFKRRRGQRRRDKDVVKGSQGAGKVDDSLDRTKMEVEAPEGPSKAGPRAQPGARKKKGRR